jgi:hypothetical protein
MAEVEAEEAYVEPAYEEEAAEPEEEEYAVQGVATEVKLFGKWAFGDIEVRDISLVVRFYPLLFVVLLTNRERGPSLTRHIFVVTYGIRTTLLARVTMPRTCPTPRVGTPRNAFARHPVPLWNVSCVA